VLGEPEVDLSAYDSQMAIGAESGSYRLPQVFVVGQLPTVTYSPRESKRLNETLNDYLDERGRILVVTGPTKTGKTVLLRRAVADAIWVAGGNVDSVERFWRRIIDETDSYTGESLQAEKGEVDTESIATEAGFAPGGVGGRRSRTETGAVSEASRRGREVDRDPSFIGREALLAEDVPLIIDDFHHIPPEVQRDLVRQLKPLIDRNAAVIFAAVPHRAADIVAAESEMEGRVENLQIGLWDIEELVEIAEKGFRGALRVDYEDALAGELAERSLRSPHLMQLLCRELAKSQDIRMTATTQTELQPPVSWEAFLGEVAEKHTHDGTFRTLARGPQSRSDRIARPLREGGDTDIYGAILSAVSATGPAERIHYNDLREALRGVLVTPPQKHEITACLRHLTDIAQTLAKDEWGRLNRDPVLEYVAADDTLYIADPFFAFRMRWGRRE
jgi:hypothetical protein